MIALLRSFQSHLCHHTADQEVFGRESRLDQVLSAVTASCSTYEHQEIRKIQLLLVIERGPQIDCRNVCCSH